MSYEINVAKKQEGNKGYRHFFATAERSIDNKADLKKVYNALKNAFPEPEYDITISYNPRMNYGVNPETFEHKL
jgi:hypothetical protein